MSASTSSPPQPTSQEPPMPQGGATAQGAAPATALSGKPAPEGGPPEEKKPAPAAEQPEDKIRALLQNMGQLAATLGTSDPGLQVRIGSLALMAEADPSRTTQNGFRTSVAYALQDLERATGKPLLGSGPLADEMRERATTMPGLELNPMRDLLAKTPTLTDTALVESIRQTAQTIARLGNNQDTDAARKLVDALHSRARPTAAPGTEAGAAVRPEPQSQPTPSPATAERPAAGAPAADTSRRSAPQQDRQPAPQANVAQAAPQGGTVAAPQRQGQQASAIMDIVRKMRAPVPTGAETVTPLPASPLRERISLFEERLARGKTDRLIMDADQSGVRAIEAMEQFIRGPGRGVLGKIEAAASTEPDGMQGVMREMQPGGRYSNLRTEFDNAYQQDQTFRGAYDKMVDNVTKFGRDRDAVTNNLTQRNLDPAQMDGRFQRTEEALGESLSKIPGKEPGKSAFDEVAGRLAEILHAAVERVKSIFRPGEEPQQQARPSPSMSP